MVKLEQFLINPLEVKINNQTANKNNMILHNIVLQDHNKRNLANTKTQLQLLAKDSKSDTLADRGINFHQVE
jgi:hypothetical protein